MPGNWMIAATMYSLDRAIHLKCDTHLHLLLVILSTGFDFLQAELKVGFSLSMTNRACFMLIARANWPLTLVLDKTITLTLAVFF